MPLYEYRCEACSHQFEKIQRFSDDPISVCPSCGQGPVVKLLSSPAIQFKGSGWYITDYARKGGEKGEKNAPASTSSSAEKGEAAAQKPESTPASSTSTSDSSTKKD
jgi:putative FmdB family regulatory protein